MSIIRQDRQQAKALVVHFGDQLNVYLREELQIFEGTAGDTLFQKCPFWEKYISNIFNDYYGNLPSAGQNGCREKRG